MYSFYAIQKSKYWVNVHIFKNLLNYANLIYVEICNYRVSLIDVHTLWNIIPQQQNETEIQFLLCMIQKALEKNSNTFIILCVFKQTWRWNYHLMNVSGYWNVIGSGECWSSTTLEGWIWFTTTTTNKSNNNKNPRQIEVLLLRFKSHSFKDG